MDKVSITLHNAQQGHQALLQVWETAKPELLYGNKLFLKLEPQTRSLEQNAKMWACLADISEQVEWYGQKLSSEDWKHILSASVKKQRAVPGIDGGFVVLGQATSKMTVAEMSELIELAIAFGTEHDVKFKYKEPT